MGLKEKISVAKDVLQLISEFNKVIAPLIPIVVAIAGAVFGYLGEWAAAAIAFGLGIVGIALIVFLRMDREKKQDCPNPNLVIERHEVDIEAGDGHMTLKQDFIFRALRKVKIYFFKFYWTGAPDDVQVTAPIKVGDIYRRTPNDAYDWHHCELRFRNAIDKNERREATISFSLSDPERKASPHYQIAYDHVKSCEQLRITLRLKERKPRDGTIYVSLLRKDGFLKKEVAGYDAQRKVYIYQTTPQAGIKYRIAWGVEGEP